MLFKKRCKSNKPAENKLVETSKSQRATQSTLELTIMPSKTPEVEIF